MQDIGAESRLRTWFLRQIAVDPEVVNLQVKEDMSEHDKDDEAEWWCVSMDHKQLATNDERARTMRMSLKSM